ncbi:hypothetical protein ES703_48149 [subsurface metagenome]
MNSYILLAKQAIENYIENGGIIAQSEDLPEEFLNRSAGAFVTIMKNGELRGCIGTFSPTKESIAKEIISNAIAAATQDHRFGPIQKEELPHLAYIVYVLSEPKIVKDFSELDPKKYGIIVKTDVKSGLLLPDLAGVDTKEEQIAITCQKGGIDPQTEKITIYKFTVERYA